MSRKELARRYVLFIISLFFSGLGVAFTKHGELGVSPISSVANVLFIRFPKISMGNWLILWNCVMIAAQIAIPDSWYARKDLLLLPLKDESLSARIGLVSLKERQYAPFMTDFMKTAVSSIRDTYKKIDALRGK